MQLAHTALAVACKWPRSTRLVGVVPAPCVKAASDRAADAAACRRLCGGPGAKCGALVALPAGALPHAHHERDHVPCPRRLLQKQYALTSECKPV